MSRISKLIRAYVDDPESTGRLHYGKWGALRPDQRRMIRQLCDECDAFEKAADQLVEHYETIIREKDAEIERLKRENAHLECVAEVAVKNRDECAQELHYLSNVEIPYLYEALEGKGKDADKLLDILANALKKVRADAITEFSKRMEKSLTAQVNAASNEILAAFMWCLDLVKNVEKQLKGETDGKTDL